MIETYITNDNGRFHNAIKRYSETKTFPDYVDDLSYILDDLIPEFYILNMHDSTVLIPEDSHFNTINIAGKPKNIEKSRVCLEEMTESSLLRK